MDKAETIYLPYKANASGFFESLRHLPDALWFDSGHPICTSGQFDIITADPSVTLETNGKITTKKTLTCTEEFTDDPFDLCEKLLSTIQLGDEKYPDHPFTGGLAGYFGYDLCRNSTHKLPKLDTFPDMRIGLYEWALTLDHFSKKAWIFFNASCSRELKNKIINYIIKVPQNIVFNEKLSYKLFGSTTKSHYIDTVKKAKEYILSGDCYQINYAQHFSATTKEDSWKIYKDLRIRMAAPYSCYYQLGRIKQAILSFSPERFLKLKGDQVITQPIKGTVSRGKNSQEDTIKAKTLIESEKNKAENLMIVDLLRNDLSKNCKLGSVKTPELFKLESFKNVHHLVSTVTGIIKDTATPLTLLRDCFPGGSITGAPKKRVMEIIDELELCKRSVYCGSIGYISANGLMDTNIAIRTILSDGNKIHCWGGGGIVADSDAEDEYQEILDKVGLLIKF